MAYRSAGYRKRAAISVVTTGTSSTADVIFTPSDAWDEFWQAIDASGYGIRVTEADGVTALAYAWTGFNKTTKSGTIQIDGAPTPNTAGKCVLYWVYYDTDSPTDGSSAVTIASPLTAAHERTRPDPARTFAAAPQPPGALTPLYRMAKRTDDAVFVWFEYTDVLQQLAQAYNGRLQWEEAAVASVEVLDSTGAAVGSMTSAADQRWVVVRDGARERVYLRVRVQAGTDGAVYTLVSTVLTDSPSESPYRTTTAAVAVHVRDVLASGGLATAPLGTSGWATYTDTTHTSGSPQSVTSSTRVRWTNDGGTSDETYAPLGAALWASNVVTPGAAGEAYVIQVECTIDPASGGVVIIGLDEGSDPFGAASAPLSTRSVTLNGSAAQSVTVQLVAVIGADALANGLAVAVTPNVNCDIYNKKITILRIH